MYIPTSKYTLCIENRKFSRLKVRREYPKQIFAEAAEDTVNNII
jgi:hypothetical protein